jgi:hypothetical protein
MGLPHLEHGRIPISARLKIGLGRTDDMTLPSVGREHAALSVTDDCRYGAVMRPAYLNSVLTPWSILLSSKRFKDRQHHFSTLTRRAGRNLIHGSSFPIRSHYHQGRLAMELILIIVVLVVLFGGGGYYGRRRGHW